MQRRRLRRAAGALAALALAAGSVAAAAPVPRVEARSGDLLAVGVVHDDIMSIHVSRLADNAPLRDAAISVLLRGAAHVATAEADGSYTVKSKDLTLPGSAVVEFQVTQAAGQEALKGTLEIGRADGKPENANNARQLWWWVLNFAVCFGILWLYSRRRKSAQT